MIGKLIGWCFDLIGALWNGFWNVCGKLFGLILLMAFCGVGGAMVSKFLGQEADAAWMAFKTGAFVGFVVGGIHLIIHEVGVPVVQEQLRRARQQARKELDEEIDEISLRRQRRSGRQPSKHLN